MPRKGTSSAATRLQGAGERLLGSDVWTIRHADVDLHGIGDRAILGRRFLALICSVQCPGSVVIKTFDAIRELRDTGIVVAGGFHSPMEKECLDFLLRGVQPVIVCLAKGLGSPRLPPFWRTALDAGRLVIVSPFDAETKRTTKANAQNRNEVLARLAACVLIPHASPGGKAETLVRQVLACGQSVFTFEDEANSEVLHLGGRLYDIDEILRLI